MTSRLSPKVLWKAAGMQKGAYSLCNRSIAALSDTRLMVSVVDVELLVSAFGLEILDELLSLILPSPITIQDLYLSAHLRLHPSLIVMISLLNSFSSFYSYFRRSISLISTGGTPFLYLFFPSEPRS